MKTAIITYILTWVAFSYIIFIQHRPNMNDSEVSQETIKELCLTHDQFNGVYINTCGVVVGEGDFFWDLLFIKSCQVRGEDGSQITVFCRKGIPRTGSLVCLDGCFWQFYVGVYVEWLGIVADDFTYYE